MYFSFRIKVPAIIESIILYFVLRYRKKRYGYAFRKIRLFTNRPSLAGLKFAIVDPDDYAALFQYDWFSAERKSHCYAAMIVRDSTIYMHRFVTNAPKGQIVDHCNHDTLDNRKANLRFATHSQNCCHKRINTKGKTSKYRGVSIEKGSKKWRAVIYCNRIHIHLGCFENEADAARAYDAAAKIYHGEFAMLNFPNKLPVQII